MNHDLNQSSPDSAGRARRFYSRLSTIVTALEIDHDATGYAGNIPGNRQVPSSYTVYFEPSGDCD